MEKLKQKYVQPCTFCLSIYSLGWNLQLKGMHLLGKENRHHGKKREHVFDTPVLVWSLVLENYHIRIRIINTVLFSFMKQRASIYRMAMMDLALSLTLQGIQK